MEAKTVLEDYDKDPDEEISSLVEDAKHKLEEVNSETKGKIEEIDAKAKVKKKDIIIELAKSLEGKIRDKEICKEIIHHLPEVSERFIRECLPEKYKQKHRVKNAKKQKQNKAIKEDEKLAAIIPRKIPLNSEIEEEEEDKKKQVMLVNVDGSTSIQNDDDDSELESESENQVTGNPFKVPDYHQQQSFKQEKNDHKELKENSNFKGALSSSENQNTKDDQNLDQPIYNNENRSTTENKNNISSNINIKNFEFSMKVRTIREYIMYRFSTLGDNGSIWFSGKLDVKTGKVVFSNLGRL